MTTFELIKTNRETILTLANKYKAFEVRIFGSVSRGEDKQGSDIDILVKFEKGCSYLDEVGLWQDLNDFLKRKVDLVGEDALSPFMKEQILKEAIPL